RRDRVESSGRINHRRCPGYQQALGFLCRMLGFGPDLAQRLAEPYNSRTSDRAAATVWRQLGQRRPTVRPVAPAFGALEPPDIAVELQDSTAAGPPRQPV